LDEQARPVPLSKRDHCEVLNLDSSRKIETVDSAGIEGKKMLLLGEIFTRIRSWSGEVSRPRVACSFSGGAGYSRRHKPRLVSRNSRSLKD
jgi:hypothetical protein